MYVHSIRSKGADKRLIHLLRFTRKDRWRDGRVRVCNFTVLNISGWRAESINKLRMALRQKRKFRGTMLETDANSWVLEIMASEGIAAHHCATIQVMDLLRYGGGWTHGEPQRRSLDGRFCA